VGIQSTVRYRYPASRAFAEADTQALSRLQRGSGVAHLAKLSRPRLHGAVNRERLFGFLKARAGPAVWVSGPPGAGKTTLLSTYVEAAALPTLWYQLDGGDADVATFFYYLSRAAEDFPTSTEARLPLLTPEYRSDLRGFSRRFFRPLFGRLPRPAAFVLDNYHEVGDSAPFHAVIREALAQAPEGVGVFIASRAPPPKELARARASQALHLLAWDELRLTLAETQAIATRAGVARAEQAGVLHELCGGWAAGLVLLLERRAGPGEPKPASRDALFDYFAAEVLEQAALDLRDLLLRVAFLPRVTPATAEALSGNPQAGKLLGELHRRSVFTDRQEGAAESYRFHALFRDFLRTQAREVFPAAEVGELMRRSAAALEQQNEIGDAAALYIEAEDWRELARLVGQHAPALLSQGRNHTVEAWIGAIPESFRSESPWLLYWQGLAHMPFGPRESREHFVRAYARFKPAGDAEGSLLACAAVLETYHYEWTDFKPADEWIRELEALMSRSPDPISPKAEARLFGAATTILHRQPLHPLVGRVTELAVQALHATSAAEKQVAIARFLLFALLWRGESDRGLAILESVKGALDPTRAPPLALLFVKFWEIVLGSQLAEHDLGRRAFDEALAISRKSGVHLLDSVLYGFDAYLAMGMGDLKRAEASLERMQTLLNPARRLDFAILAHWRSGLALLQGDFPQAQREAQASIDISEAAGAQLRLLLGRMALAQALVELNEHAAAREQMAPVQHFSEAFPDPHFAFIASLAESDSWLRDGDEPKALAALRTALAVGRSHDYMTAHPFWQPKVVARLCALALAHRIEPEYVKKLIRRRGLVPPSPEVEDWPWPVKVFTLGRFSLVLDDAPVNLTGRTRRRTLELLQALVALGGRDVAAETLCAALWPDTEGDAAHHALESSLHRLRKLIGKEAVLAHGGRVTLDRERCWVDVWAIERLFGRLDRLVSDDAGMERIGPVMHTLRALYRGPFLGSESRSWLLATRERLRGRYLRALDAVAQRYEHAGAWVGVLELLHQGLDFEPLEEGFYRRLMLAHEKLGQRAEALAAWRRCQRTLSAALGIAPSAETEAIARRLRQ
jgi:LuxR family maltose regulon positive regulatory protein